MKLEKESNYKELIPKLIQKSNSLSKELKNRIKLNHIFSEFESKATNQFNFFIKESEKRYLGSKYGSKIEYLLKSSQKRGKKEASKILSDKFYLDPEIQNERLKMQKKATHEIHQNITDIINKIKGLKSDIFSKNVINSINSKYLIEDKEKMEKNKTELNYILGKDEKRIKQSFNNYRNALLKIKPFQKKINTTEEQEQYEKNKIKKEIIFDIPKMQLLSYKKVFHHNKTKKDEDEENRINIKKLISYSVSGKNILPNDKNFNYISPIFKSKKDSLFSMKSTKSIVIQKAMNEFNNFRTYHYKNDEISKRLGIERIPSLTIYEKFIKNSFNKIKLERRRKNELIYNSQKLIGLNSKDIINNKIQDNLKYLKNFEKNYLRYNNTISV